MPFFHSNFHNCFLLLHSRQYKFSFFADISSFFLVQGLQQAAQGVQSVQGTVGRELCRGLPIPGWGTGGDRQRPSRLGPQGASLKIRENNWPIREQTLPPPCPFPIKRRLFNRFLADAEFLLLILYTKKM